MLGDSQEEVRTLPWLALDAEISTEQPCELARECEAEARSSLGLLAGALEGLEDDRLLLRCNSLAIVDHVELQNVVGRAQLHADCALGGAVTDRVRQEVDQDLPYPLAVGVGRHLAVRAPHVDVQAPAFGRRLDRRDRFAHDVPRIHLRENRLELLGVDAAEVQQVLEQVERALG